MTRPQKPLDNDKNGSVQSTGRRRRIAYGVLALVLIGPLIGLGMVVFGAGGLGDGGQEGGGDGDSLLSVTLAWLFARQAALAAWQAAHPGLLMAGFACLYIVCVTFSLPGAAWLSLLGGYLFGPIPGAVVVVCAATIGAVGVFTLARWGFAGTSVHRAVHTGGDLIDRLRGQAFWMVLGLRLVPVVPFWLVNLAAAAADVRLRTYTVATALGIIPGALIYTAAGHGVGTVLAQGVVPDLATLTHPYVLWPVIGLGVLSFAPVVVSLLRQRSERKSS